MPAYLVAEIETRNPTGLEPYRAAVAATVTQYGGRFLVRGGATELIEGESGGPGAACRVSTPWMPAFAGTTRNETGVYSSYVPSIPMSRRIEEPDK